MASPFRLPDSTSGISEGRLLLRGMDITLFLFLFLVLSFRLLVTLLFSLKLFSRVYQIIGSHKVSPLPQDGSIHL
ncbi:hypothetical protein K449DRAFT_253422 [Hypoxylon sp. EC38]|nr:hypothetical protein K449DRAFT_253422 [Hypoxylon sp. EC38]